jgi:hypothetical protein
MTTREVNGGLQDHLAYASIRVPEGLRYSLPVAHYDDARICRNTSSITVDVLYTDLDDPGLCEQEFRAAVASELAK